MLIIVPFIYVVIWGLDIYLQRKGLARPPHGNRQGNGSGLALWMCISSPLFDILREQGYGIHLCGLISATHLHIVDC